MEYCNTKIMHCSFETAKSTITEVLKTEGFGIVSEIDMQSKFKEKLGVEFRKYTILGACNPKFAYEAVQVEETIGVLLPCNIVLIEKDDNSTQVSIVNPLVSMQSVENSTLNPLATEVASKLTRVLAALH
jgi:uncharacterized protein (DUF302 family)